MFVIKLFPRELEGVSVHKWMINLKIWLCKASTSWVCMFFKFWIFAICVALSLQTSASMSFSMASWASNMIISVAGCGASTCGDNVDNTSLFPLGGNTRSTFCEAGLSCHVCKGSPIAFHTLPFVLGVGCPICCDSFNPMEINCLPMDFNFHPLVF